MAIHARVSGAVELLERFAAGERVFSGAKLRGANLAFTDLNEANLSRGDLSNADLRGADLRDADLTRTSLHGADLGRANLSAADLSGAKLGGARLSWADLSGADLSGANLNRAHLESANLRGTNLSGCTFIETKLEGAEADENTTLGQTVLLATNLASLCRATPKHEAPSHVDFRSVALSVHEPLLKEFLHKSGMPDVFVEYMVDCAKSLSPELIFSMLQSTFISYGGPDEAFARKLNDALQTRGVTTFFFKEHATPGDKLHRVMRKWVNDCDRTILICSESSLQRPGLLNELEETLARESRDGGRAYLIPVRLDDYVINDWKPNDPDVAQAVRDRVIADFRDHENSSRFDAELVKLVAALKKPGP